MTKPVVIVGAGPAGLALAIGLARGGVPVTLVERMQVDALADPAFDGREIALTHSSIAALKRLGAWQNIPSGRIYPLASARVLNGKSPLALTLGPRRSNAQTLGMLVSNCDIRRAMFETASKLPAIELLAGRATQSISTGMNEARIGLNDGDTRTGSLLVAADSRFSELRAQLGIAASMNRLGKSMLVGRVAIERHHGSIATEWFDNGQTLALLPLGSHEASVVVTLRDSEAQRLAAMDDGNVAEELTRRFARRFGEMRPLTRLHLYPLTTSYARHFVAPRAVLVGDAAVGMHPVTAHGFNLGLAGTERLTRLVTSGFGSSGDPGNSRVLRRFEAGHRLATWPLYAATNAIVGLYTDDRPTGRLARNAGLLASGFPPVRNAVTRILMRSRA